MKGVAPQSRGLSLPQCSDSLNRYSNFTILQMQKQINFENVRLLDKLFYLMYGLDVNFGKRRCAELPNRL